MPDAARAPYDVDRLVDVAVAVFLEHGYDRASMGDIARASGLGKSSLYHHVSGKEELLDRGVGRALDVLIGMLEEAEADSSGLAVERLRRIVRRTVEITMDYLPEVALLLRVRGNSEAERHAVDRRREFDRRVSRVVREAMENGSIRDDVDPLVATRLVFGMTNSTVEWYRPRGAAQRELLVDAVERLVFDGLQGLPRAGS
jgi:AcrR family transcriptional regulator